MKEEEVAAIGYIFTADVDFIAAAIAAILRTAVQNLHVYVVLMCLRSAQAPDYPYTVISLPSALRSSSTKHNRNTILFHQNHHQRFLVHTR